MSDSALVQGLPRFYSLMVAVLTLLLVSPAYSGQFREQLDDAIAQREAGLAYAAIFRIESMIRRADDSLTRAKLQRLKLELAKSYYDAFRFDEARVLVEEVLQEGRLPKQVLANVNHFAARMAAAERLRAQPHRWHASLRLLYGRDDNADVGPDEQEFEKADFDDFWFDDFDEEDDFDDFHEEAYDNELDGEFDEEFIKEFEDEEPEEGEFEEEYPEYLSSRREVEDTYQGFSVGLNHRYRMRGSRNFGGSAILSSWQSSLFYFSRSYQDVTSSDFSVTSLQTGPVFYRPQHWRTSIDLRLNYIELDRRALASYISIQPSIRWFTQPLNVQLSAGITNRQYQQADDRGKEGDKHHLGLALLSDAKSAWRIRLAIDALRLQSQDDVYSYDGFEFQARLGTRDQLPVHLFAEWRYQKLDYDGRFLFYDEKRERTRRKSTVGVSYTINDSIDLGLKLTLIDNEESLELLSYDKRRLESFINFRF